MRWGFSFDGRPGQLNTSEDGPVGVSSDRYTSKT